MAKLHRDNAGYIGCSHEETQDPYYSYNKLSLPLSGATETVQRPAEVTHTVTVAGGKFVIGGVSQATLSLIEGGTYKFDQSDSSNSTHPFKFSQTSDGTHNRGTEYTKGVTYVGTPGSSGAYTQLVVPFGGLDLYYYCGNHSGMGGSASTPANAGMFTAALPILKTTDAFGKTLGSGNNVDPYAANLVLAIPMNGSNNGTTFTDVSNVIRGTGTAKTITVNNNAKTSTAESFYYGSSGYFDGSGDRLVLGNASDLVFDGDFTMETWLYINDANSVSYPNGDRQIAGVWTGSNNDWLITYSGTSSHNTFLFQLYIDGSVTVFSSGVDMSAYVNKWVHLAVVRNSGAIQLYVDGVPKGNRVINGASFGKTSNVAIGGRVGGDAHTVAGYLADFRIYKGVAKYKPEGSGSLGMDVVTYTGNGSTQSIDNLAFQPDFVWIKRRNSTNNHRIFDSVRGVNKSLSSDLTSTANTSSNQLTAFNSNGFDLGSNNEVNQSTGTYVAWAWKAGGAATTIAAGSLNSSVYDQSQTWSNYLTTSGGSGTASFGSGAFGGFDDNNNYTYVGGAGSGTNYTITFTPPSTISYTSSLIVRAEINNSEVSIDGGSTWVADVGGLVTFNGPGSFSSIICRDSRGQFSGDFYSIRVDGKLLVDSGVSVTNVPSIASSVSANTSYGFSITSYVGNQTSGASIGHGLNAEPKFAIIKSRDTLLDWIVYHASTGNTGALRLNTTQDVEVDSKWFNNAGPSSSTFTLGNTTGTNKTGDNMIAYMWSEVSGFSKFGSFSGTGVAGLSVTTGFKPRYLIIKRTDTTGDWWIWDTARGDSKFLYANGSNGGNANDAVVGSYPISATNTGFSIDNTADLNISGATYVYAAFAESAPGDPGQDAFKILETLNTKDQSSSAHTITNSGASFQTSVKKFYDGAASFSGGSSVVIPASSDLQFGTGDFTIEGWMHPTSYGVTYPSVISKYDNGDASWIIRLHNSGQVVWYSGNGNNNSSASGLSLVNSWNHISAIRNSGVVTVYLNGSQILSVADTHDYNDSNAIYCGRQDVSNVNGFEGYLQDWSIYKGIAKYTSSFSPPERSIQGTARRYPSGVYVAS